MFKLRYTVFQNVIYSLITGFIAASAVTCLIYRPNPFATSASAVISLVTLLIVTLIASAAFFTYFHIMKKISRSAMIFCGFLYAVVATAQSVNANFYFTLAIILIIGYLTFAFREVFADQYSKIVNGRWLYAFVGIATAFVVFMICAGTLARHWSFSSSNFDFGLFAQMYESMATDFTQNTTLERNELLSHFAVHFSPIYYVLLPFYMLFRNPESLLVMQVLVIFSGVVPLIRLCKKWRYSEKTTLLICLSFLFYPAFHCAAFYDFHENIFLVPLLLWLFFFLEKNSLLGIVLTALTVVCVKEDAGIYLLCIGLYAVFNKDYPKKNGLAVIAMGIIGFVGATAFLEAFGEGIKTSRYAVYLNPDEDGLITVVLNVIKNPALFLSQLLSEKKIVFVLQMLLPLGFVPFFTRKFNDWFLFLPFALVNLASAYVYQSDINFQYIFGSGVILIFMFARNARYVKKKNKLLSVAVFASVLICLTSTIGKYKYYCELYDTFPEEQRATDELIDTLDRDACIVVTTYIAPHLYDFTDVYMYPAEGPVPELYVIDNRSERFSEYKMLTESLLASGYVEKASAGFITVFEKQFD